MRTPVFVLALVIGALIRLAALSLPGTADIGSWKIWAYAASDRVTSVYGIGGTPPSRGTVSWGTHTTTVDYPPAAVYELGAVGYAYRLVAPDFPDTTLLVVLLKMPGLLCGIALTALFYRITAQRTGRRDLAQWAALACWLNPALVLNAEALGNLDPWMMLPAILALLLLHGGAFFAAGVLAALAVLTKPHGALMLPALLVAAASFRGMNGVVRVVFGGAAATLALVLPFALAGALPNVWLACRDFFARRDGLSADTPNLWLVANWALQFRRLIPAAGVRAAQRVPRILTITRLRELGLLNPRVITTALAALVTLGGCWQARRSTSLALHAALGAFTVQTFFVLMLAMHEHHAVLAVPLLALAAALRPTFRPLFYSVSALVALDLNLFHGIGRGAAWAIPPTITGIDMAVVLAVANVIVLIWFAAKLGDEAALERQQGQYTTYEVRAVRG